MAISQETRLKKAHVALMRHPETAMFSGVMLMGTSSVEDKNFTAYTDGVNKKYGREFITKLNDAELRALVLHENLHIALKHVQRFTPEFKDNAQLTNSACDFAVNDVIVSLNDKAFCTLPEGGLVNAKYHNWSVRDIYNDLKANQDKDTGKVNIDGEMIDLGEGFDEHDFSSAEGMSSDEIKEVSAKIDRAIREGGILAGRMGSKLPRQIEQMLEPTVDWKEVLREFVSSTARGNDEYTWRKFNKRMVANDLYLPSLENESVGELVIGIDTSGSIGTKELTEFASELSSICKNTSPSKVRVLWWDTEVHGEQVFDESNYDNIATLLKPQGGGGTYVTGLSKYILKHNIKAEGVIVFTDGYVEDDIDWQITTPTLWLVTQRRDFKPPKGKVVRKVDDHD
jgi:predicted metal-dependent peptidase